MENNNVKPIIDLDKILASTGKSFTPVYLLPNLLNQVEAGEIVLQITCEMSNESLIRRYAGK